MINGEIKNKVDALWNDFAAGGLTNPLEVIEQITYLMFIHELDSSDNIHRTGSEMLGIPFKSIFEGKKVIGNQEIDGRKLKWSVFRDLPAQQMFDLISNCVFPFIKDLPRYEESMDETQDSAYSKYMGDAVFKIPSAELLSKAVDSLDSIYETMDKVQKDELAQENKDRNDKPDVQGDLYEYLLSKLSTAGRNGQFRTPRHIIKMMVKLMNPTPDDKIADPACGTSGFLVAAAEYLKNNPETEKEIFFNKEKRNYYKSDMFTGYDMDGTMLRIGAMNMMTHGITNPNIQYRDSLSDKNADHDEYSLILANPPFKGSLDYDTVSDSLLKVCKTKKTELLFLALFLRMLKVGGRCACIVPDGVLFGSSRAHKAIRKQLVEENRLEAVISMPSGVFKPYAGVSTAILIFTKTNHGGTDKVWFYDMTADGYSLDDKRTKVDEDDIPDIIERFNNLDEETDRKRTEKSFFVDKKEIVDNGYDLSINRYKEIEYVPVKYPPTEDILAEIMKLDDEANKNLQELKNMLEKQIERKNKFRFVVMCIDKEI